MRTLWFIRGAASGEQIAHAAKNGLTIRDVSAYSEGDFIERADAVTGDAPPAYTDRYTAEPMTDQPVPKPVEPPRVPAKKAAKKAKS